MKKPKTHRLTFEPEECRAILEFADPTLLGAVTRMVLTRANRDPLFRELVEDVGRAWSAYQDFQAREHAYDFDYDPYPPPRPIVLATEPAPTGD